MAITNIISNKHRLKLWQFFMESEFKSFNISEISIGSNVSRPTVYRELKWFLNIGAIKKSEKIYGRQGYKLNPKSQEAFKMSKIFDILKMVGKK
jgi:Fe2+ or Zn2+ uptake regulation protein